MDKKTIEKEAIIAEYLTGAISYRKLGDKYGIDFRLIHSWVAKFQGRPMRKKASKQLVKKEAEKPLPTDVKQLQQALRKEKLHNQLLNAIIDIAEKQLKIDIRKKPGTKR
ncbi:MAG: hypothetical protein COS42_05545 [Flavobacteriales bacterium CG03_land_8_20_14_0_80_35_15]|nr:MAG: hypothetical protein COS42_05545 [Flavobacteriales bacterium CG03_land_8_20_14_0_80_35_15]